MQSGKRYHSFFEEPIHLRILSNGQGYCDFPSRCKAPLKVLYGACNFHGVPGLVLPESSSRGQGRHIYGFLIRPDVFQRRNAYDEIIFILGLKIDDINVHHTNCLLIFVYHLVVDCEIMRKNIPDFKNLLATVLFHDVPNYRNLDCSLVFPCVTVYVKEVAVVGTLKGKDPVTPSSFEIVTEYQVRQPINANFKTAPKDRDNTFLPGNLLSHGGEVPEFI